ncbi:hypothetical protein F5890DRAFT_178982 [Lentinula detonsa]|uniref:DRBM domain-containing protein n=1 Tax=Lentinula detonsa TaxID=2804962 RepID=A0AA38Q9C7_9AGAR|nr:hypothetical protein F5890DRAFT_178982 [Lentinula detonsa]
MLYNPLSLTTQFTFDMAKDGAFALNNFLQKKNRLDALSWVDSTAGPSHSPQWTCVCKIDGEVVATGTGSQKHVARDIAANQALKILIDNNWA